MKNYYACLLLVTFTSSPFLIATGQNHNISKPVRQVSLPENPCEMLSPEKMSAVTGLEIISAERVRGIRRPEDPEIDPGGICSYQTRSEFGAIMIVVPARTDRRTARYWEERAKYFEDFPGASKGVTGLGMDAWVAGGNTLHVLVRENQYFSLSTQMWQPQSRDLLVNIARAALAQL